MASMSFRHTGYVTYKQANKMSLPQSGKLGVVALISALGTVELEASLDHIAGS